MAATRDRFYRPRGRLRGAWLISPGAHYEGPSDPRLDRLCRMIAAAGFAVLSPAVPDLMRLRMTPAALDDAATALDRLAAEVPDGCKLSIFGVSVGSLAALRLAAARRHPIARVVLLGGYADPNALIRSILVEPRDPLNGPVALSTFLDHLPGAPDGDDAARLRRAWHRYVRAVWPRAELKVAGSRAHHPIALDFAGDVPERLQPLFLIGCGVLPGAWDLCRPALEHDAFRFLDPRPHMRSITAPVHIVHGLDDAVIPFSQLAALAQALPPGVAHPHPTGLIAHSGAAGWRSVLARALALPRELRTLTRIVHAIAA